MNGAGQRSGRSVGLAVLGALALSGCVVEKAPSSEHMEAALVAPRPQARPDGPPQPAIPAAPPRIKLEPRPQDSSKLALYYRRVQNDLLSQEFLRIDGGGQDTPYVARDLTRNFIRIAFYDEYRHDSGLTPADNAPGLLRRWEKPVRFQLHFGDSIPLAQKVKDSNTVRAYASRLANATRHPVSVESPGNFHVLFMGEADRLSLPAKVREIAPRISEAQLDVFRELPRSLYCFVIAFASEENGRSYGKAIALIRSEHPDLLRTACIHEELAQGLGLSNDSPQARPSIFNDNDEFAYLTRHDEKLLRLLYDPRLRAGMSIEQARPVLEVQSARLMAEGNP